MRQASLTRLFILVALLSFTQVAAGWFGSEEPKKKDRRRQSVDTVEEYDPSYEPPPQAPSDRRSSSGGASAARRERMEKVRKEKVAKSKDEMMSDAYNQKIADDDELEDTITPEDDGNLDDESINRIWAEHMHDFVPEDMMNVVVERKTSEALLETIGHEKPTTVKGAYYVLGGNKDKTVSMMVYGPGREILYKRHGSA